MKRNDRRIIAALAVGVVLIASVALAMPAFVRIFTAAYKISDTSVLGNAGCAVCHVSKSQTDRWNPYGEDLQRAMKAANASLLTKAILQRVENLDSDKDGYSNIAEIKADTLPGDPKSHPSK